MYVPSSFLRLSEASELCNLDDSDIDLDNLKIRIREGKGGETAMLS